MIFLTRSDAKYMDHRQAVVDRFNAMHDELAPKEAEIDWAELFAELIHAYECAKATEEQRRFGQPHYGHHDP